GFWKATAEPDQTPLLAHEAYSADLARRRLRELSRLADESSLALPVAAFEALGRRVPSLPVSGLTAGRLAESPRPVASLADVRPVAEDFVILRTLPGGLAEFLGLFDFGPLGAGWTPRVVAVVQSGRGPVLGFFDDEICCRLEAVVDPTGGYAGR